MTLQWIVVSLFLAGALFALGRSLRSVRAWLFLGLLYGAAVGGVAWWSATLLRADTTRAALAGKAPGVGGPAGYVGSESCRSCHPDQYASWHRSFHRTMTQLPTPGAVRGDFGNVTLELNGEKFHLERRGGEFWVDMVDPDWQYVRTLRQVASEQGRGPVPEEEPNPPRSFKRISLVTGSHHMQAYWTASEFGNMQFSFPFTFLFEENRWVPRDAVFLLDPRTRFIQQVWNINCINCHATVGQPRKDPKTLVNASRAAELGIACEACHGPAETHARLNQDPVRRYALHHRGGPDASIFNPARAEHVRSAEACGQCHAIRVASQQDYWNREGTGTRPGEPIEPVYPLLHYDGSALDQPAMASKRAAMEGSFWRDGQVRVSGREFQGLSASGCYQRGRLSCVSCHSMHGYQDADDQLAAGMGGNQACAQCHQSLQNRLAEHTHHAPDSSGSLCYNCHMPHTTYGLIKAIRSHRIDSPTVKASLETGRPNACNLCHLDRTLDWTSQKLNAWYQQPLVTVSEDDQSTAASLLWLLRGDAGQRALVAWHMGWNPARQTSGDTWLAPYLAELLVDPYATVRYIAQRSLKRLPGFEQFRYDYIAPLAQRAAGREQALHLWRGRQSPPAARLGERTVLLNPSGERLEAKVAALLRQRDDHRMNLLE